ncbi:MAG: thiamine diphosphokinase [Proteobacteria bacterium]|nr:thiamine diphosphokinase [Pseudomonadota bacterium]
MKKVSVILGGDGSSLFTYKRGIENSDLIIACDRGGEYLKNINVMPDVVIGDMDSISKETLDYFEINDVKIVRFDKHKDFTDAYLAFDYVAKNLDNYTISVYAFSGGRGDHFISALIDAEKFTGIDRKINFIGGGETIRSVAENTIIRGDVGDIISIFSFSGAYTAECRGLMYDISNTEIPCGMTRGISNELTEKEAYITIKKGKLTIFHHVN